MYFVIIIGILNNLNINYIWYKYRLRFFGAGKCIHIYDHCQSGIKSPQAFQPTPSYSSFVLPPNRLRAEDVTISATSVDKLAIATNNGSVFTQALYDVLLNNLNISYEKLNEDLNELRVQVINPNTNEKIIEIRDFVKCHILYDKVRLVF